MREKERDQLIVSVILHVAFCPYLVSQVYHITGIKKSHSVRKRCVKPLLKHLNGWWATSRCAVESFADKSRVSRVVKYLSSQ